MASIIEKESQEMLIEHNNPEYSGEG